jgi:hypothetical protein
MQMINLMKRLADLDSTNPNVVKESQQVEECGMMPEEMGMMGGMGAPHTPASINMTAGSGEELGNLLKDIMSLAGMSQHSEPEMGEPAPQTLEPMGGQDATTTMRSVIDKLHPETGDDDSGEEGPEEVDEYDNTPADPNDKNEFDANQYSVQQNQPGQGDRMDGNMPKATMEQQLMADYKEFIGENRNDESAKWRDPKYKDKLYTQEPDDGEGDHYDYYHDSRPENDPGEKHSTFDRNKDTDKLHYPYGDYQVGQKAQVGDRAKKGLLTKNAIRVVKNRINGTQGNHPRPNLPK